MSKKTKYKIKKRYQLGIVLMIIIIICMIPIYITENSLSKEKIIKEEKNISKEELISSILSYNIVETVNKEFLEWISKEYSISVLEELNNSLKQSQYNSQIWHNLTNNSLIVLQDQYNKISNDKTKKISSQNQSEITISFVGDISLADNWYIMPKYDERNKKVYGILSEDVVNIMTSSDIMVANNEFTISNRGTKIPNKLYTFKAVPERLTIYKEMGVDLVTLANNHIYDYGEAAFLDALDALEEYDIPYIGAGRNLEEAKQPYYFIINGYKIGFVNATRAEKFILTKEATETNGGVLKCYDPTTFIQVIEDTKKRSDYVIALVHWGREDSSELEQVQIDTAKQYIDAGADVIVGSHAHTLQGIDFYKEKAIIYNLGDFIFNNETKDTGIFQLKINQDGTLQYYFKPCKEREEYTYLLTEEEQKRVLAKMSSLSPNVIIKEDGNFYQRENTSLTEN